MSHLNPVQFGINELALGHPEWTGETEPLHTTTETVRPSTVRFTRYPADDPRTASAIKGFTDGAPVPAVSLVRRAGETMTADGHHRLSAAEHLGKSVEAEVTHSPRTDPYTGRGRTGTKRKPRR